MNKKNGAISAPLNCLVSQSVHFSSKSEMWETPQDFFDKLHAEFRFDIDVCALPENAKCGKYYTPEENGLIQKWSGTCWMNPPYGRVIGKWIKKAYEEAQDGATVVCLVPARTDTVWWHDYCLKGEVRFLKGRLKFQNRSLPSWRADGKFKLSSAPFPSAVVIFRG
jgi:phage N-6-adenine-methyltransferase